MTEWPDCVKQPPELWDDEEILKFVREYRGESHPVSRRLLVDDIILWMERNYHEAWDTIKLFKYWRNEYYKEMHRETR